MSLLPPHLRFLISSNRPCWLSFLLTSCQRAQFLPCAPLLHTALSLPPNFLHGHWLACPSLLGADSVLSGRQARRGCASTGSDAVFM